ncbi:MAG: MBL fold metallo-hydrolase [Candidatus Gracilibacteria bacterium]|nr:MBL fold metallo-hydrolase [Candidatus Gracilibacteria bacterium]
MATPKKDLVITFLGSGNAFCRAEENYQSNILITREVEELIENSSDTNIVNRKKKKKHFLFDAGATIADALHAVRVHIDDIDTIFISHQHADHIGGLENIAFKRYFGKLPFGQNKPHIVGNADVLNDTWHDSLKGGLQSIQGEVNSLESYFTCTYLDHNGYFLFYGIEIEAVQTLHSIDNKRFVPSYGIIINGNERIFITGDTQFAPNQMFTFYEQVDWIFQDCEFANYPKSIHAQFHQLCKLPDEIRKKMYLYHYSLKIGEKEAPDGYIENIYEAFEDREKMVLEAGFAGLVKKGQQFPF